MSDRIFINDLIIEIFAGIYEHEKSARQRIIINIILGVESNQGSSLKSINDVVSYEYITNQIMDIANAKHYELLEELAENIAAFCLIQGRVNNVTVRLEKPDIIENTKSVGIEIIRVNLKA